MLYKKQEDEVIVVEFEEIEQLNKILEPEEKIQNKDKPENKLNETEDICSQFDESELEDLDVDEIDCIKYGIFV